MSVLLFVRCYFVLSFREGYFGYGVFGTQDVHLLFEWHIVLKLGRLVVVEVDGCLYFR